MKELNDIISAIDALNAQDPRTEEFEGKEYPKEVLYSQRMTSCLEKSDSNASIVAQIAVRAQHLCRWKIPRNEYPIGKAGYSKWRIELGKLHARLAAEIVLEKTSNEELAQKVSTTIRKKKLKANPDAQTMEDCACLVFLEFHFTDFVADYNDSKVIDIVAKTWKKMSDKGHEAALKLDFSEEHLALITKALNG
mgnify:CR=1 FL=1